MSEAGNIGGRIVAFMYNGHAITRDADKLINLTEMWEAAGADPNRRPAEWARRDGCSFINDLTRSLNVARGHIYKGQRGRGVGATRAHWQIALAYAKYLSDEFHRFVNDAFREWVEEKADPGLKARRAVDGYRARGWADPQIMVRLEGIVKRHRLTDTLKEHGVGPDFGYARCTDAINREVLGASAKEIRLARGIPKKDSTRDHMSAVELAALQFSETLAAAKLEEQDVQGEQMCEHVCRQAGAAASQALTALGLNPRTPKG